MGTIFSKTLVRMRGEAGYPTAYRFFHSNGGTAIFKITYRNYLLVEQGKSLPSVEKLSQMLYALRLPPKTDLRDELVVAWLKTLVGEAHYADILQPVIKENLSVSALPPMHKAMRHALSGRKVFITPDQFRGILSSRETYLVSIIVSHDVGLWPLAELARCAGLSSDKTRRSLDTLVSLKLVKKVRKDVYQCGLGEAMAEYPHLNSVEPELAKKMAKYREELISTAPDMWRRAGIIHADRDAMRNFIPLMQMNLSATQSYSVSKRTGNSALFFVEGKLVKLRDL